MTRWMWWTCAAALGCTPKGDCEAPPAEPVPPDSLATFEIERVRPGSEMAEGFLLLTQTNDQQEHFVSVVDGCGDHVWWTQPDDEVVRPMRARVSRDGASVLYGDRHKNTLVDINTIKRVDITTREVVEVTRALDHHHDWVEMETGELAYLSRVRVPDDWFGTRWRLAADALRVGEPGSEDADAHRLVFSALDDLGIEPFWTCTHMRERGFLPEHLDWTHANSLDYEEQTGEFTMLVRHFDGIVRLRHDGTVKWWLGGPLETLTPLDGAAPVRHGHFTEAAGDRILVFDNGNHVEDAVTRVVEYEVDEDAGTYREAWSYPHPEGKFFGARGDARRLPGGNTLIAWTGNGEIWEVTPEGDVVWRADTRHQVVRMEFHPTWPPP